MPIDSSHAGRVIDTADATASRVARGFDIETAGKDHAVINVELDPKLLELFAAGLYRSSTKAIEELVTNAFDAEARRAIVRLPQDPQSPDATIWVVDDGEGMTLDGLRYLWMIGRSRKAGVTAKRGKRQPIGQFGIGKLATFLLGERLTYVSRSSDGFLAVTMNFASIQPGKKDLEPLADTGDTRTRKLELQVRKLTAREAEVALAELIEAIPQDEGRPVMRLFGEGSSESWTVVAIRGLKDQGKILSGGRLRWVLSVALPLGGAFRVWLDRKEIRPSLRRLSGELHRWQVGVNDAAAANLKLEIDPDGGVVIPELGTIRGHAAVFQEPLTRGATAELGRSNGFFIRVLGRVINLDDPLFGLPPLSHTTFASFMMEVEADGLNDYLRSSREAVEEVPPVASLRAYLREKFNEARIFYENWIKGPGLDIHLSARVGATPQSLRRPLVGVVRAAVEHGEKPFLFEIPHIPAGPHRDSFIRAFDEDTASEVGPFQHIVVEPVGWDKPFAVYDVSRRSLRINALHPFYANYQDQFGDLEPLELLAAADVLTEAYLREGGNSSSEVRVILGRRDHLLRALVMSQRPRLGLVVELLREPGLNNAPLKHAVRSAFAVLGFEVSPGVGRNSVDILAAARPMLPNRPSDNGYAVAVHVATTAQWDALSKQVLKARLQRIQESVGASCSVVIVPAREWPGRPGSPSRSQLEELREAVVAQGAVALTPEELEQLVEVASVNGDNLDDLVGVLSGVVPVAEWITSHAARARRLPVREIVEIASKLQRDVDGPLEAGTLALEAKRRGVAAVDRDGVLAVFRSLRALVGPLLSIEGGYISVDAPWRRIEAELIATLAERPQLRGMVPFVAPRAS